VRPQVQTPVLPKKKNMMDESVLISSSFLKDIFARYIEFQVNSSFLPAHQKCDMLCFLMTNLLPLILFSPKVKRHFSVAIAKVYPVIFLRSLIVTCLEIHFFEFILFGFSSDSQLQVYVFYQI
jgi:hypothetical protein